KLYGGGGMNRNRAILLAVIQVVLVLSVAGKYLYERNARPRVWVRAAQFDPNMPLRGRYLSLQLTVDACGLPKQGSHQRQFIQGADQRFQGYREWRVKPVAREGKLLPVLATDHDRPEYTQTLTEWGHVSCDRAVLSNSVDYFIPD